MRLITLCAVTCALSATSTLAGTISIPWVVEFPRTISNPPPPVERDVSAPTIEGSFRTTLGGVDVPGLDARVGLEIESEASTEASSFRFPVMIDITAPDTVRPGQRVNLETSFRPVDTASNPAFYSLNGTASFETFLTVDAESDMFGFDVSERVNLPDQIDIGAAAVTTGGTGDFSASDSTATAVTGRASFDTDPFGQSLVPRGTQTQGYQFEAVDTVDGVKASVDLVGVAASIFSPLDPVDAVVDLDAAGGLDIVVSNTLTTNLGVAYYTYPGIDNDGFNFDQINLNAGQASVVVPDTLSDGDTFDLFFSALGLGFNVLTELGLQGNFDLVLDTIGIDPLELLSFDVGDPVIFDQDITKFFFIEFLAEFMNPADAVLSMEIDSGALVGGASPTSITGPTSADDALVTLFANGGLGTGTVSGIGLNFDAPGAEPTVLPIVAAAVIPLPPTVLGSLSGLGLLIWLKGRRQRG